MTMTMEDEIIALPKFLRGETIKFVVSDTWYCKGEEVRIQFESGKKLFIRNDESSITYLTRVKKLNGEVVTRSLWDELCTKEGLWYEHGDTWYDNHLRDEVIDTEECIHDYRGGYSYGMPELEEDKPEYNLDKVDRFDDLPKYIRGE